MINFNPWAFLDLAVGRFGHIKNLWAFLVGAILVHGSFWYRAVKTVRKQCDGLLGESKLWSYI